MAKISKARYWVGVLYQENMRENWEQEIDNILQLPYAYCCHTKDTDSKSEHRKDHMHLIVVFPNTTTYNHAMSVFNLLSADGKKALNKVEAVIGIRNVYDYLIHDTEACRKQEKYLYDPSERITGNNFDIGAYEQLGVAEKNEMFIQMSEAIRDNGFTNYMDFYCYVVDTYEDMNYVEVLKSYSGHFARLTKGNYQRWEKGQNGAFCSPSQEKHRKSTEKAPTICCPECGSISLMKKGKTLADKPKFKCKDCGKNFVF